MKWWFGVTLWKRVLGALILGIAFGLFVNFLVTSSDASITNDAGEVLVSLNDGRLLRGPDGEPVTAASGPAWTGPNGETYTALEARPLEGSAVTVYYIRSFLFPIGDIFIRLIRMMIVPLIFTTLVAGVVALKEPAKLGSLGVKTVILYLATTFFANIIGLIYGAIMRPGVGAADALAGAVPSPVSTDRPSVFEQIMEVIPENPVAAFADTNILAIIFFALLFGIGVLMARDKGEPVARFFDSASEAVLKVTHIVMETAPFGVFALIAYTTVAYGIDAFVSIFWLILAVYLGLITHVILIYGGLIRLVLGLPLIRFLRGITDAQAVAFSTASSSATLPVTITNVSENLGVKRPVAGSVLPLGATINMDGTALYLGILALFTAQAFGIDLAWYNYVLIALTAAVVSIGAAGIPSASLFLLATVLSTFGASPEQIALVVGFIAPVDRVMDMARTVVNVTGDAAVAVTVAKWEGELDEETFRAPATV
jgi:Na+/H+-dicarboxylate symporter